MFQFILKIFFGSKHDRDVRALNHFVIKVNQAEEKIKKLDDTSLKSKTDEFKERILAGEALNSILPEAFACVRVVANRTLGLRHYDVQIMGGVVLHQGRIAEMKTGEGKTLTSTLAIYLNALKGKGVHVVTVNDYLAKRDAEWMKPIYDFLGISCAFITSNMPHEERQKAYHADITYGTNNEFGFDYLRDNMVEHALFRVQREHCFAIIDEVDSILIDEARTPLIISGPSEENTEIYSRIDRIIPSLEDKDDYEIDEKARNVLLTELGIIKIEKLLKIDNLYDPHNLELVHHVHQALKAYSLFQKEVDYVVHNNEVIIVDEFTGRLMEGRRYSDGLHQAIEAKEKVSVKQENQTLASITFQNYFRIYEKLAGMTGTADTEADEFKKIYNLDVVVLPTHHPMIRRDMPDKIYRTESEKFAAIAEDVKEYHLKGQPVLVGTVSIENSEKIAQLLNKKGIQHSVLNAKHHEKEAEIIKEAGHKSNVTIATNMAGRGTDIVLGDGVPNLGGLVIIASERHESRRIDNQLRGRSGRQGDSGESRFYLSLEDDLMRIFGSDRIGPIMQKLGMQEGESIEHKMVTNAIERAQRRVEGHNFDMRKHLLEYDDIMNKQRGYIYKLRNEMLSKDDISSLMKEYIVDVVEYTLSIYCSAKSVASWNIKGLKNWLNTYYDVDFQKSDNELSDMRQEDLKQEMLSIFENKYDKKQEQLGKENLKLLEKMIALQVIDQKWKDHLHAVDHLREGIWAMGYAEKNPLIEYRFQSFNLFEEMVAHSKDETLQFLFRAFIEGPIQENIPDEYVAHGNTVHEETQGYGVSNTLGRLQAENNQQEAANAFTANNHSQTNPSGVSVAARKTGGGGSSRKKGSRRKKK